jgi:hypothetical protein
LVRFACMTSARRFGFAVTSNNTSVRMVLAGNHVRRPALPTVRRDPRFSRAPDRIDNEERAFLIPRRSSLCARRPPWPIRNSAAARAIIHFAQLKTPPAAAARTGLGGAGLDVPTARGAEHPVSCKSRGMAPGGEHCFSAVPAALPRCGRIAGSCPPRRRNAPNNILFRYSTMPQ